MNSQPSLSAIVKKINELYVMTRSKYLLQQSNGWTTLSHEQNNNIVNLNDGTIKQHIEHRKTIGVFSGKHLSKFICFDIDTPDMVQSKFITFRLVDILKREYNIGSQYIIVSISGSKGYHVEIFVTEPIDINKFKAFYSDVLLKMNESSNRVEFRPTFNQGVKLPIGRHLRSGEICWYCHTDTLEAIKNKSYVLDIKQIDTYDFLSLIRDSLDETPTFSLPAQKAESFEQIIQTTNIPIHSSDDKEAYALEILKLGRLKHPRTRHNTTLLLAMLLISSYGHDECDVINSILNIMKNTPQEFFSKETEWEYVVSETNRIVKVVIEKGYSLRGSNTEIKVYKDELLSILSVKKHHLRKLLFSILIHGKRYGNKDGIFYMSYKQMSEMGNTKYRSDLIQYIKDLESLSLLHVLSRNETDKVMTKHCGHVVKKPNTYKINIQCCNSFDYIIINAKEDVEFEDVVPRLIDKNEVKDIVSHNEFYNLFKSHYKMDMHTIINKHRKRRSKASPE